MPTLPPLLYKVGKLKNLSSGPATALTLYDDAIMIILFNLLVSYLAHSSQETLDPSTHQSQEFFGQFKFMRKSQTKDKTVSVLEEFLSLLLIPPSIFPWEDGTRIPNFLLGQKEWNSYILILPNS